MLFFELLQVALGNKDRTSDIPSDEEWTEMYAESERQAVTGILLYGIERLKSLNDDLNLNQRFLLQWIGVGQMIEQRNHILDERCLYPNTIVWQPFFSIWLYFWRLSNGLLKDREET